MPTAEIFLEALQALRMHKLRSFLTVLGIVIGIAAVITMVALGEGAQRAVESQIEALGTDLLSIFTGHRHWRGMGTAGQPLTVDDAEALARDAGAQFTAVVPEQSSREQVELGAANANVQIVGTTGAYQTSHRFGLQMGRFFGPGELAGRRTVAVVGAQIPGELDTTKENILGQTVKIRGVPFEVIGVLEAKGRMGWRNLDDEILIPLTTSVSRLTGEEDLRSITVQLADPRATNDAMLRIEQTLRREHRLRPGQDNDFRIRNQSDLFSTFEETTRTFTFLLGGIAAVSLLVGGIGIMNIMLVSVTERIREIGVRKAMGATRRHILLQFMAESLILCALGGVLGILVGAGIAFGLSELARWNTAVSPTAVGIAFGFAAAVGLFFGIYPARRAATLDPIEALRHE
ncbi:MAG: FtsX-like permease family protein [Candidatus Eisenbacteria bacterium]|nr:FtsX-like permease family protein [Candidatus Eisenbacteria bacterium]